jgi:hypothetical protein
MLLSSLTDQGERRMESIRPIRSASLDDGYSFGDQKNLQPCLVRI